MCQETTQSTTKTTPQSTPLLDVCDECGTISGTRECSGCGSTLCYRCGYTILMTAFVKKDPSYITLGPCCTDLFERVAEAKSEFREDMMYTRQLHQEVFDRLLCDIESERAKRPKRAKHV